MYKKPMAVCLCCVMCLILCDSYLDNSIAASGSGDMNENMIENHKSFGASINLSGDPIGGGKSYSRIVTNGDHNVANLEELLDALNNASSGEVVYVEDEAVIDMTGIENVVIPCGVTLASGRNGESSKGALIYTLQENIIPLLSTGGEKVRLTGIRLRGPDMERRTEQMKQLMDEGGHDAYYRIPTSAGIQAMHPFFEVDNCELYGWSHGAVYLKNGATDAYIHHNYIHHNQRSGLGYGVVLDKSDALIEANIFDWCRHNIAGTGSPGTGYEARFNLVFEHANGHSFDMHGGKDREDGTNIAGDFIIIHHNTFMATNVEAVVIRGEPARGAEIHHNWFLHQDQEEAVSFQEEVENIYVYQNQYTRARVVKDSGNDE